MIDDVAARGGAVAQPWRGGTLESGDSRRAWAGGQQAAAQNQAMVDQFKKAVGVCVEGRGYNVK